MLKPSDLTGEDREGFFEDIRNAIYHLLECWDSLRDAERRLDGEIETDQIQGIASDCTAPHDAYSLTEARILEALGDMGKPK